MTPSDSLRQSADVFEERGRVYGDAYKNFGHVLMAIRPNGFAIRNVEDANRLGVFTQIVSKIVRYANQFEAGGHDDSLLDLSTYAAMLRELDAEGRAKPKSWSEQLGARPDDLVGPPGRFGPVGDSVVPRGDGFRVGEIEP
jgi:hypothetical protein